MHNKMNSQKTQFADLGLSDELLTTLKKMDYVHPTPIQAQAIPVALKGHDILGSAQTGTGKTAAFSIPVVEHLIRFGEGKAIVITPTRELGKQVIDVMHKLLGRKTHVKTAFLIGGDAMNKQLRQLKEKPSLIVGTPGRISDHIKRGTLKLDDVKFLVLDETDRMLDMGFSKQIDAIVEHIPTERQTMLFSATLPENIVKLSQKYLNDPVRIAIGSTHEPVKRIEQTVSKVSMENKYQTLVDELDNRQGSIIIFVRTKRGSERLARNLTKAGYEAEALHGDLKQSRRARVIKSLRDKKYRILVATDIASRGLDVPHVRHVINYDLPQVAEDYIHRIGRTARAGKKGEAISLVAPRDGRKWKEIEALISGVTASNDEKTSSGKSTKARNGKKKNLSQKPRWSTKKKKDQKKRRVQAEKKAKRIAREKQRKAS